MNKRFILVLALLATALISCRIPKRFLPKKSPPTPTPTAIPVGAFINIAYTDIPNVSPYTLSLDIYPADQTNSPVIFFVHGGGWYSGDKSSVYAKPKAFNNRGYTFISVNYRLIPDVTVSDQISDVANALAWTIAHVDEYNGSPSAIYLMGHSAGGYIVSLLGTDESYIEATGYNLSNLRGVISLGVETFNVPAIMDIIPETERPIFNLAFGQDRDFWLKVSPIAHIAPGKGIPPFFIAYTTEVGTHPDLPVAFADALTEAGISSALYAETTRNHFQIDWEFGIGGDPLAKAVFQWLELNR